MEDLKILTATEASRAFSEMLHRVCYGGESFIIMKGKRVMARILPPGPVHEPEVAAANEAAEAQAPAPPAAILSENQILHSASPSAARLNHDEAEYFRTVIEGLRKPMLAD